MKVAVIYESTRGRTKAMAEAICEGVTAEGGTCDLIEAKNFTGTEGYCAIAVGSSTRMKRVLPTVKRLLADGDGTLPQIDGLPAGAFGSYGWSGEAPDEIASRLAAKGAVLVIDTPIKAKDYPGEASLAECRNMGAELVRRCKK
ncbi:MAG: flavodoxin domain-containing protein [Candidatus Thorarchaeota archaeon]